MSVRVTRRSQASWRGTVGDGGGRIGLGSGAYEGPFSLKARVEDVERATNPEELIAAAEAGCFTMSLANILSEAGHPPDDLQTTASVRLEQLESGFAITRIELKTTGRVSGVDPDEFGAFAERAKATCPVSRALAGTEIVLEAVLAGDS
ncbi:MAG: OsmC family peroxiredoxin [Solirubrobacterales bacterium]|nr:OsmC family peroxiredoxin [Solirubrobacterales bacterium]MBV9422208.1 OsmC family peroxiredoxin [Solirubrobacterales bacterium]MBV9800855.1 OsmC family peroxiredoxin [Solirubrobacterales bacterium]